MANPGSKRGANLIREVLELLAWAKDHDDFTVLDVEKHGPPSWRELEPNAIHARLYRLQVGGILIPASLRPLPGRPRYKAGRPKRIYRVYKPAYRIGEPMPNPIYHDPPDPERMRPCKLCGAPIGFVKTGNGNATAPVDADGRNHYQTCGQVSRKDELRGDPG